MDKQIAKIEKESIVKKNLVDLKNKRTIIFLEVPIKPIARQFKDSLYSFLLSEVWGMDREVEEDIRVTDTDWNSKDDPCLIRYQFGNLYAASERMDYVADLIEEKVFEWVERNGGYESVCPPNLACLAT